MVQLPTEQVSYGIQELLSKARKRLVTIGANAPLSEAAEFLFEPTCPMIVVRTYLKIAELSRSAINVG